MAQSKPVVVDIAGAFQGGAARFLQELEDYLTASPHHVGVRLIGRDRSLDPAWLFRREMEARAARRRIALNNAAFSTGNERVVLLRNALHFMMPAELAEVSMARHRDIRLQTPIIRALAARADLIITPSSHMAERVVHFLPSTNSRIEVRFHPVTAPLPSDKHHKGDGPYVFLMPVIKSAFKALDDRVTSFVEAAQGMSDPVRLWITADPSEYPPPIRSSKLLRFIGRHPSRTLEQFWRRAHGVYFPTAIESFGYALAEGRARGMSVIALDSELSREIAGPALCAVQDLTSKSLTAAIEQALNNRVSPDPGPFSPNNYFERLLHAPI